MTYKIIVFSSNPQNTARLRLNREFSEIENVWESSRNKDHYTVLRVPQARVDQLAREILETKARIVHFCGHGLGNQGLVLETKLGEQQLVSWLISAISPSSRMCDPQCLLFRSTGSSDTSTHQLCHWHKQRHC